MSFEITVIDNDSMKDIGAGKLSITDANGKRFEATIDDIVDCSKYVADDISTIGDNIREKMLNFKPIITDSEGVEITDNELLDAVKSGKAIALDVTFEATHSGENLNNAVYTSSSLENDTPSWIYPFKKPLIKNHDMNEEPIGRVLDAHFGPSEIVSDKDCINVTFRVSDEDAMAKFADGRYKTMSIGARSGSIRCNTCGKDILKDGQVKFCGHWKGEFYAGKKTTWTVENMTFKEGSIVNGPADVFAQVKNIKIVKKKEDNGMDKTTDSNILDDMTNILNGQDSQENPNPTSTTPEHQPDPIDNNNDGEGEEGAQKSELEIAHDKIIELESQVDALTKEKEELTSKLEDSNASAAVVASDNEALRTEVSKLKDQTLRLATFNLDLMKDNLKALDANVSDAELEGKSAKEIADMIKKAKEIPQTRDFNNQIPNPGMPVKDKYVDTSDDEDSTESKEVTMKDMENVILDIWGNKH